MAFFLFSMVWIWLTFCFFQSYSDDAEETGCGYCRRFDSKKDPHMSSTIVSETEGEDQEVRMIGRNVEDVKDVEKTLRGCNHQDVVCTFTGWDDENMNRIGLIICGMYAWYYSMQVIVCFHEQGLKVSARQRRRLRRLTKFMSVDKSIRMEEKMNGNKSSEKKGKEIEGFRTNGIMLKRPDFGKNQGSVDDGHGNGAESETKGNTTRGSSQGKGSGGSSSKVGKQSNGSKAGGPTQKKMNVKGNRGKKSQKNEDHNTSETISKAPDCRTGKKELLGDRQNRNAARSLTKRNTEKGAPQGKGTGGSDSRVEKQSSGRKGASSGEKKQNRNGSNGTKSQKNENGTRSTKETKSKAPDRGNGKNQPSPDHKKGNIGRQAVKRNNTKGTSCAEGKHTGGSSSRMKGCTAANTLPNNQNRPS